jgi:hypothetical protein
MPSEQDNKASVQAQAGLSTATSFHLARHPRIVVFGVEYLHLRMNDGSDLYVTRHGLPFVRQLLPDNHWTDKEWLAANSTKLPGTSAVYRITTKEVMGTSRDIVLKWNRMGQDIPGATDISPGFAGEFNSPFEEFDLVMELRKSIDSSEGKLCIPKPSAIYVPRKHVALEKIGRKRYKMEVISKKHEEISLDLNRQYAVIYEWIPGIDSAQALREGMIDENTMRSLVKSANEQLQHEGFVVGDSKPHHVIIQPSADGALPAGSSAVIPSGLVDFELLDRTPQREKARRAVKREAYLKRQAHRFEAEVKFPPGLSATRIMGVDYVCGTVESTGGALWVVGKDPLLFEYFLPEKWRKTPRTKLSVANQVYKTVTKDSIHLVWRVSRVGEIPDVDPFFDKDRQIRHHGYNSPFEEIALSMHLFENNIETTYPRAIYMTGQKSEISSRLLDKSKYESHGNLRMPDGRPILSQRRDYIIIWGYWNGPDEMLAARDQDHYRAIDALEAYRRGRITEETYMRVVQTATERLHAAGVQDLNLRGSHLLLSLDGADQLVTDQQGLPTVRICNFELLKRVD